MKEPSIITQLLEEQWASLGFITKHKRTIMSKWRKLFKANGIQPRRYLAILHQGNSHYMVESESRVGQMHAVETDEHGKLRCICEDAEMNKNKHCKHVQLVQRLIDESILPGDKS